VNHDCSASRSAGHERWRLSALALATAVSVAGCAIPGQQPIIPAPLNVPPSSAANGESKAAARSEATRISPLPMPPAYAPPAAVAVREQAAAPATGEPVSINLEQVSIGTFAQLVFGDLLKKNVNVDAAVMARKDLVTFRSGAAQAPAQIENAARLLLKTYGVSATDLGGLVRVVPDSGNLGTLPEIRRGAALPETPVPLRPIFQLIELQAVQQVEVINWLRTMFGDRVKIQDDLARNAILLSGTPENMQAAIDAIRVLDQPILRGVQSVSIAPVYWSADELARRLYEVLSAEGYAVQPLNAPAGGIRFPLVILPVSGLNAVFVFARGGDVLTHVTDWARNLDKPNDRGVGKNFFTYTVKHKDATTLAATLEQLLGRGRTSTTATTGTGTAAAAGTTQRSGAVVVDVATNMLIFQTNQDEYSQLIALLQTLDRPTKSALIEVTVAELSLDDKSQLGVEWLSNAAVNSGGRIVSGTAGGLSIGTSGFNLRVLDSANSVRFVLNALASDNKATVLSSPRVLARNGEQATIQVGQEVPIITSQQSTNASTTSGAQILQTVQYRSTGVILKVKPVIHSSDQIDLDVSQEVSGAVATTTGVNVSPTFTTRKVDTKLTLRNGATVLLGGLISDENSRGNAGIPLLKDIPLIGNLFNTQTGGGSRRELVILITPYVINDDHEAESVTSAFRKILGPWADTVQPGQGMPASQLPAGMKQPASSMPLTPGSAVAAPAAVQPPR
jgi:general secretion pathway protein D